MHERLSANSLSFIGTPIEQMAAHWHALDARCVSIIGLQLTPDTVGAVRDAVASFRLETVSGHIFMPGHITPDEEKWAEARVRLGTLIELAAQVGARSIYMLTGGHGTLTWEQAAECFSAAIAPCVEQARQAGIALMIEGSTTLHADIHITHTLPDTITVAEMAGIDVCIDLFACWAESGLRQSIERAMPRCRLVQLSDYVYGDRAVPCRAVPGDGVIPLERLIGWILDAGYEGVFDFELLGPRIDQTGHYEATRRAAEHVSKILESFGK